MIIFPLKTIAVRFRLAAKTFRADGRGLAATEFAMILPLMLVFVFGTIEVTNGFAVDRKVVMVTRTLSDITSRAKSVSSTDLSSFLNVAGAIMQPYSNTPLVATISEVYIDPNTSTARVQWSQGSAQRSIGSAVTVPAGLISKDANGRPVANQYLIYSEVKYAYVPAVGYIMNKAGVTLQDATFTRPRESICVIFPTPPANISPDCPTS